MAWTLAAVVIKFTILVDPSLVITTIHYYTLSLSDPCLEVDEKIFKEIMHFHYVTDMVKL